MSSLALLPLLAICGPTAAGKTELAIACALRLNGEMIGGDALQVYRHMDIGTAKPTPEQRALAPIHLIDCVEPGEPYSVAQYQKDALEAIAEVHERGNLPILAGGSGLYMRSVTDRLDLPIAPADPELRRRLEEEASRFGPLHLHARLAEVDPRAAQRIEPHNVRRVIRALEVHSLTGRPMSEFHNLDRDSQPRYNLLEIGLSLPREELCARIEARIEAMMAAGFAQEVKGLLERGFDETILPMQALGYRHIAAALAGRCDVLEAVRLLKRDTRRYAKRQMTWFRADKRIRWLDAREPVEVLSERVANMAREQFGLME